MYRKATTPVLASYTYIAGFLEDPLMGFDPLQHLVTEELQRIVAAATIKNTCKV
jgi:hypothetical protein